MWAAWDCFSATPPRLAFLRRPLGGGVRAAASRFAVRVMFIQLDQPHQATTVLHEAHEHFTQLGALPALAETDTLLERATALSS